jgi:diguanylate cyclase (GGDEF)-like protein
MRDSRDVISAAVAMPCIRNTFSLALGHRLAESARRSDPLSIILIRIDDYSDLCSRYGLKTSNDVLDAAAKFFIASVRAMDWVARFDATTFAFLLPNTTGTQAQGVAERLRIRVAAAHLAADGNQIQMTVSAGVTETSPSDDGDDVLHRAEMALETSIQAGGNQTHCSLGHVAGLVRPSCLSPSV